ncbi:MAG: hypothetical protein ACYC91_10995 [Solirubrobacteraceae bacterium]
MAEAATDVRVAAVAEPGLLIAEANAAVLRPMSMPVVDRVASGVGTAVRPIRPDHREVLQVNEPPARLAGPPDPRNRDTVTRDLTALQLGGAARILLMHHRRSASDRSTPSSFSRTSIAPASHATSLASPTLGEVWNNTCHASPTSSRHGADGRKIDLSAQFIELTERLRFADDVVGVGPARSARKTLKAVS